MSITNNGTAVSKSVMTKGIDAFADEQDNTMNPEPPLKPTVTAGPGKEQG
jgi:hypothetical protein